MENNIKASQLHAVQYWFADGLAEISGAVICLLITVYFGLLALIPASQAAFALLFLAVFIAAFGIRKLMFWLRQRSTYPRTGYVEPKKGWENRTMFGIAIAFTVLLMVFMLLMVMRGIQTLILMPAIGGAIYAFVFIQAGYRVKLLRFYFLAGFCFLLGLTLSASGLGDLWGAALLSFVTSLLLFSFGIATRISYLRQPKLELSDEQ
jgi:hypothetical protein